jgi:thiamine kinase-like enzyme
MLEYFGGEVVPIMEKLVLFEKPCVKNAFDYVQDVMKSLDVPMTVSEHLGWKEYENVTSFIHAGVQRIRDEGNHPIHLVFSHGDFVPANMLKTTQGIQLIDWEDANCRSALFDFYSYFFCRAVFANTDVQQLSLEIKLALPILLAGIGKKAPALSSSIERCMDVYRQVFCVELMCKLLKREMTDTRLNVREIIRHYLEVFSYYDERISGVPILNQHV